MKRFSIIITIATCCLLCSTVSVKAQDDDKSKSKPLYRPFRIDIGAGYAMCPTDEALGGGVLFNIEPKYALPVLPQLSVGLKLELDLVVKMVVVDGTPQSGTAQGITSYLATGDFHLLPRAFRPFVGAGLGFYKIAGVSTEGGGSIDEGTTNFGALLRCGFDVSHFRLVLAYNLLGKDGFGNPANFYCITLGSYIGGGRKRF